VLSDGLNNLGWRNSKSEGEEEEEGDISVENVLPDPLYKAGEAMIAPSWE
jgi:hypothetical protein